MVFKPFLLVETIEARTATIYNSLGFAFHTMDQQDSAIFHFTKALEIDLKILNPNDPTISSVYDNIAWAYSQRFVGLRR